MIKGSSEIQEPGTRTHICYPKYSTIVDYYRGGFEEHLSGGCSGIIDITQGVRTPSWRDGKLEIISITSHLFI